LTNKLILTKNIELVLAPLLKRRKKWKRRKNATSVTVIQTSATAATAAYRNPPKRKPTKTKKGSTKGPFYN